MSKKLYIIDIGHSTIVDGPGLRTSIYGAGCDNHCQGCHNPESWELSAGRPMSIEEITDEIEPQTGGVTFSGGDPFFQAEGFTALAGLIKRRTGKNIWCYTGLTFERICEEPALARMLPYIDVLVDGRFVLALKSDKAVFRGSTNQRLVDVPASLAAGKVVLWPYNPKPEICRSGL